MKTSVSEIKSLTIPEITEIAKIYRINPKKVDMKYFKKGIIAELEHGEKFGRYLDITGNDLDITIKIVIAHLLEAPDYYQRLETLERQSDKYWKNRDKNIFL